MEPVTVEKFQHRIRQQAAVGGEGEVYHLIPLPAFGGDQFHGEAHLVEGQQWFAAVEIDVQCLKAVCLGQEIVHRLGDGLPGNGVFLFMLHAIGTCEIAIVRYNEAQLREIHFSPPMVSNPPAAGSCMWGPGWWLSVP